MYNITISPVGRVEADYDHMYDAIDRHQVALSLEGGTVSSNSPFSVPTTQKKHPLSRNTCGFKWALINMQKLCREETHEATNNDNTTQ